MIRSGGALAQQQPKTWRIGFLTPRTPPGLPASDVFSTAFVTGMRDLGYRGGENLIVEWRYAAGDYKRLAGFAAELVVLNLQGIVTYGTAAAKALKAATQTVRSSLRRPVDLVGPGIINSLVRPGRNITGLSLIDVDSRTKARRIAWLDRKLIRLRHS